MLKAYGELKVQCQALLLSALDGVSGQLHVLPALSWKKEAVLVKGVKVWWTTDVVWGFGEQNGD